MLQNVQCHVSLGISNDEIPFCRSSTKREETPIWLALDEIHVSNNFD